MSGVLNDLGQNIIPTIFASLNNAGLTDLMDITSETNNSDSGGGYVKASTASAYSNVPVAYEPQQIETRAAQGGKQLSALEYILTFPTYTAAGARINVTPSHRLKVLARGSEPIKTFRIIGLKDLSGVYWEAVCTKEN